MLVAQTGLLAIRSGLCMGHPGILERVSLGDRLSVAETLKILGNAPPWSTLKLVYGERGSSCERQVDKVLAELDFVQTVNDLVGAKTELNPSLNAVAEAFKRRQLLGAFVSDNHEINLDALLHSDSSTYWFR